MQDITFTDLQKWLEDSTSVPDGLHTLILRLMRRWKSSIKNDKWEKFVIKFCYTYSDIDAWEVERVGFSRCLLRTKIRIIKNLFETQFDCNVKFKENVNELA